MLNRLLHTLDTSGTQRLRRVEFLQVLANAGLLPDDPRLQRVFAELATAAAEEHPDGIKIDELARMTRSGARLISKALMAKMVIPDFAWFCEELEAIFARAESTNGGRVTTYVPAPNTCNNMCVVVGRGSRGGGGG